MRARRHEKKHVLVLLPNPALSHPKGKLFRMRQEGVRSALEISAYANRAAGGRLSADELAVATRFFLVSFFPAFARQMWSLPLA